MALRLHWSPDSANLVVRIALEEFGLLYDAHRLDRSKAAHRHPSYLAMNPQGLIPVLEDGPLALFETGAILLHLAERVGKFGPDGPAVQDAGARATHLKWLFYLSNTVHADLRVAFYTQRYVSEATIPELRRGLVERLRGHMRLIEDELRATGGLGGGIGILDIYLCCCLRWAQIYPGAAPLVPGLLGGLPKLQALARGLELRPAVRRAMQAESIAPDTAFTHPVRPALPATEVMG